MKIATLAVAATAFLHLKGPDGTLLYEGPKKVGIDLYGPGSPEFARIEERQSSRAVKRMQENDGKIAIAPADQRRAEAAEDLVALTAAFHHIDHDSADGKPLSGPALYLAVYSEPSLGWIREQALKFVGDWGPFYERLGDQLSLYVRHLAYLNAKPKPPEGSKRAKGQAATLTRAEAMKRDGVVPPMPPNPAAHIIERLIEIGISEAAGMGVAPLSWQTLRAWQYDTWVRLAPWEARLLRRLSIDYVTESHRAEDETCPPPWRAPVTQREIETETARLRMVLG